jgi:Tol biopolymer transport system component
MKKNIIFTAGFLLALSLPLFPQKRPATIDDLMKIRNVQEAQISPEGDRVVYVISEINLEKNISNSDLWLVGTKGGPPVRLTCGPGRDESPRWSPDGKTIAFISDRDETSQIWLINPRGGEAFRLTGIKGGVSSFAWSPDGVKIAFLSQER